MIPSPVVGDSTPRPHHGHTAATRGPSVAPVRTTRSAIASNRQCVPHLGRRWGGAAQNSTPSATLEQHTAGQTAHISFSHKPMAVRRNGCPGRAAPRSILSKRGSRGSSARIDQCVPHHRRRGCPTLASALSAALYSQSVQQRSDPESRDGPRMWYSLVDRRSGGRWPGNVVPTGRCRRVGAADGCGWAGHGVDTCMLRRGFVLRHRARETTRAGRAEVPALVGWLSVVLSVR